MNKSNSFDSRKYRLSFSFETREQLWRFYDTIQTQVHDFKEIPVNFFKTSRIKAVESKKVPQ